VFLYLQGLSTIYALNSMVSTTDNEAIVNMLYTCEDFKETTFQQFEVPNDGHSFFASAFVNPIVQAQVKKLVPEEALKKVDDPRMLYIDQLREMVAKKIEERDATEDLPMVSPKLLARQIRWKKRSVADLQAAGIPSEEDFYKITREDKLTEISDALHIIRSEKSKKFKRWKNQIAEIGFEFQCLSNVKILNIGNLYLIFLTCLCIS
jgi:hypothetical protein